MCIWSNAELVYNTVKLHYIPASYTIKPQDRFVNILEENVAKTIITTHWNNLASTPVDYSV